MKIALYGLTVNPDFTEELAKLLELLKEKKIENFVYGPFLKYIQKECGLNPEVAGIFENSTIFLTAFTQSPRHTREPERRPHGHEVVEVLSEHRLSGKTGPRGIVALK